MLPVYTKGKSVVTTVTTPRGEGKFVSRDYTTGCQSLLRLERPDLDETFPRIGEACPLRRFLIVFFRAQFQILPRMARLCGSTALGVPETV